MTDMRIRSWPFLLLGFGALLALLILSAIAQHRRVEQVRNDVKSLQAVSHESSRVLEALRSEIYLFAVLLRDYLLERSPDAAFEQRRALEDLRRSAQNHARDLQRRSFLKDRPEVQRLRSALEEYWRAAEPVFAWTPEQKAALGPTFLRQHVAPQRQTAFALASEIETLSRSQASVRQQDVLATQEELQQFLRRITAAVLALGLIVAVASILRTRSLEASASRHLHTIERAAEDLRRLSSRLAKAQEDERRNISRELHDQVGQMLTALRMEIGNLEEYRSTPDGRFAQHLADARKLAEETLRSIRDISTGLRPSVLDELGLGPALKWQAREFMRRSTVPVELQIDGCLDGLPDTHRTCVYRVVQEALTNCARHARASHIRITIHGGARSVAMTVADDGVGFDVATARAGGIGLLGAEERVRELNGKFVVLSEPSKGTLLHCEIPTPKEVTT
jgi:signal transduction histidine kinase